MQSQGRAMLCVRSLLLLVIADALVEGVQVGRYPCGSRIGIDSGSGVEAGWAPQNPSETEPSENQDVEYRDESLTDEEKDAIESVWGTLNGALLFELPHTARDALANPSCSVTWDPRESISSDTSITALTLGIIGVPRRSSGNDQGAPAPGTCNLIVVGPGTSVTPAPTSASGAGQTATGGLRVTVTDTASVGGGGGVTSFVTIGEKALALPVQLRSPPGCVVKMMLLAHRQGDLAPWYKWALLLAFSVVVLPMAWFAGERAMHAKKPFKAIGLMAALYVGFVGSAIGLAIELGVWRTPVGHFPFPGIVTLLLCSCIIYGLSFLPMIWRHPSRNLLGGAILRMLIFGCTQALMVGYWSRGFAIFGALSLVSCFLVNAATTHLYLAYKATIEDAEDVAAFHRHQETQLEKPAQRSNRDAIEEVDREIDDAQRGVETPVKMPSGYVTMLLWVPFTMPVAPLALIYAEIVLASGSNFKHLANVKLFDVMLGLRFIIVGVLPMLGLLCAACAFQTSFIVALGAVLVLVLWSTITTIIEFAEQQRTFRIEHGRWASLLWPAIHTHLEQQHSLQRTRAEHRYGPAGGAVYDDDYAAQSPGRWSPARSASIPPAPGTTSAASLEVQQREAVFAASLRRDRDASAGVNVEGTDPMAAGFDLHQEQYQGGADGGDTVRSGTPQHGMMSGERSASGWGSAYRGPSVDAQGRKILTSVSIGGERSPSKQANESMHTDAGRSASVQRRLPLYPQRQDSAGTATPTPVPTRVNTSVTPAVSLPQSRSGSAQTSTPAGFARMVPASGQQQGPTSSGSGAPASGMRSRPRFPNSHQGPSVTPPLTPREEIDRY